MKLALFLKDFFQKKLWRRLFFFVVYFFSFVGFSFVLVYFAVKIGLTNTEGIIDTQNTFFQKERQEMMAGKEKKNTKRDICTIAFIQKNYPADFFYTKNSLIGMSEESLGRAASLFQSLLENSFLFEEFLSSCPGESLSSSLENKEPILFGWARGDYWGVLEQALERDREVIEKVSLETGVPSRLLIAPLVVEQLRLYSSQREIFKRYFAPLKVLGAQTQFSWGIYGIKRETALQIEKNLKDTKSPFYLGKKYETLLDYGEGEKNGAPLLINFEASLGTSSATTTQVFEGIEKARFVRLTSEKDHYYSYLYAALYIKQIMTQWETAGYPLENHPEIVATIYNIGFAKSIPKENPQVGGAEIDISGKKYSFGRLAYEFYYSGLLEKTFPLK